MSSLKRFYSQLIENLPEFRGVEELNSRWEAMTRNLKRKIIVLDDDPTGTQTVANIPVYTSWERETLERVMDDSSQLIYILTNSRSLTVEETKELHHQLGRRLAEISREQGKELLVISRSDSTLRGYYPLETEILAAEIYQGEIDGEIIIPFFKEGGRITYQDVHFVKEGDQLIPAGETEFARDTTFGYRSSNLKDWIEEKTEQRYKATDVVSITLEELRNLRIEEITDKLTGLSKGGKVIVNAVDYQDLKVFVIALLKILGEKKFIFRTAASFVRIIGGQDSRGLLSADGLYQTEKSNPKGLVVVGSYVEKTTRQLAKLQKGADLEFIELKVGEMESIARTRTEVSRVSELVEKALAGDKSICVYTTRDYYSAREKGLAADLVYSTRISQALVEVVSEIADKPDYIIAKGGITSSDIVVKALGVKRAEVIGQVLPGIPVWRLQEESRFPGIPYVIFPGNVGDEQALKEVVQIMSNGKDVNWR